MSIKPITAFLKANLGGIIAGVFAILWALTIAYAESWGNDRWQRRDDAQAHAHTLAPLPAKIEKLETWQADQKAAQNADDAKFNQMLKELTAIQIKQAEGNAIMSELVKSNDRVLRRLDAQGR